MAFKFYSKILNKEALLNYMLCGFLLRFIFTSGSLTSKINPGLYTSMSPCSIQNGLIFNPILFYGFIPLITVLFVCRVGGGGGGVIICDFVQICTMRFWREIFTAISPTPSLKTTIVPSPARYLGINLCGLPCSMTSWPHLQSSC